MVRSGPPELTDYQRVMAKHDHYWEPIESEPWIIEDGNAVFTYQCQWQPTKTHTSEFRTVEEPIGEPCGDLHTIELECQRSDLIARLAQKRFIDGDYEVIDVVPPNPNRRDTGGRLELNCHAIEPRVIYE